MELTSSQRKFLRSAARSRRPDVIVGKSGPAGGVLDHIRAKLDQIELVKVRLLESAAADRAEAARKLAADLDAALVGLLGRVAIFYRPSRSLEPDRRIRLPGR